LQNIYNLWENYRGSIVDLGRDIVVSILIAVIGVLLYRGFNRLILKAGSKNLHIDNNAGLILRRVIRYGIFIICAIMILNIFGFNTASLIALLGAAGVAVGLALKDTLGNIAAGIILIFLGSFRRGEFVEFGSFSGTVKEINLFNTILETPDGIYISAPNSSIWGNPLRNYTRNGKRRMELSVRVSYTDSLDTAFGVLKDIIACENRFLQDPPPQVILQSLQDSSVILAIRAWASNQNYWDIYWQQMRNLKEKIEGAGLHIPYPQNDVHIVQQEQTLRLLDKNG
jgi:small conductance mechanosensitive channel